MEFWLNPGALVSVNALTKVTMTPAAAGETPPPGATIIPPMSPLTAMAQQTNAAMAANTEVATQAAIAAQAAQEAVSTALAKPWEVTFREKQ